MSIVKWLTGGLTGGDASTTARLDAELAELLHSVRTHVEAGTVRSVAVASSESREGRSRVALYLAELLADNVEGKVLLVDADGQRPSLHEAYQVERGPGLTEVLSEDLSLSEAVQATLRENQLLLTAGTAALAAGVVVTTGRVEALLSEARADYQVVVLDTGPLLAAQESLAFCQAADVVVLVVLAGLTQGEILSRAHRLLQRSQCKLLGVVINDPRGEFERNES